MNREYAILKDEGIAETEEEEFTTRPRHPPRRVNSGQDGGQAPNTEGHGEEKGIYFTP